MRKTVTLLIVGFVALGHTPATVARESDCGIVLMHGKWASPQFMGPFANRLKTV
jgi:hypothetical protein